MLAWIQLFTNCSYKFYVQILFTSSIYQLYLQILFKNIYKFNKATTSNVLFSELIEYKPNMSDEENTPTCALMVQQKKLFPSPRVDLRIYYFVLISVIGKIQQHFHKSSVLFYHNKQYLYSYAY